MENKNLQTHLLILGNVYLFLLLLGMRSVKNIPLSTPAEIFSGPQMELTFCANAVIS